MAHCTLTAILVILTTYAMQNVNCATFINCNNDAHVLMNFSFPDPMRVKVGTPLSVLAGALVRKIFPDHFIVRHSVERRFYGRWWKLPCFGAQGKDCRVKMPCQNFIKMGFNGTCPIQPYNYQGYHLKIPVPKFHVPLWLFEGLYRFRVVGYGPEEKEEWFCGSLTQYVEQDRSSLQQLQQDRTKVIV